MKQSKNIYLIGPMGAGKTTIGRLLAKSLGVDFVDSDKQIEQRTGVTIPMIFEYEGEVGFRRREAEVLAELTPMDGIVMATGGGSILLPENRELIRRHGFVVYLHCPVEKQLERTHKDANRPLLNTENPRQKLLDLFHIREPIYRSLADFVVDTGQSTSRSAVRQILRVYHRTHSRPGKP
ncbi:shikimate kinase [Methylomagnum ishizawai]|uniref:Shikimate kinase n=1 Tax=Methylomagnum ishizawai TaxID=1760988 RepID=A0A1Y6CV37_9GAMM|nr:shikimate kinase AroK [Methylomagnum ishizawai]SMF94156.1 shikimate kinase [Methylomagnum ishizawai]